MQLYQFQTEYLKGLPSKFIFSADTGTGKTILSLAHYAQKTAHLEGDAVIYPKRLLIIAPAAKIRTGDWERHVAEFFGSDMPQVDYYSYEKFTRNPTRKEVGKKAIWKEWCELPTGSFAVIADEAHKLANPQSGIGKAMFQVAQRSGFFVGLTATPLPNGWISAANYFKIFGFTPNVTTFKRRYCNIQTYKGFPEIVGYYNEDELKRLWNSISKPLRKEDAIDLPDIVTVAVEIPTAKQYPEVRKTRMFNEKLLDNPSAYLHGLRQATVESKIPWLDEFVEGVSSNIVIFYNYVCEREAILQMLQKNHKGRTVFRVDGAVHELPKPAEWPSLKRTITLAQYQSGSTGVEMTYADTIVFFSPTYSYTLYHQSVGRIERIGQKKKMTLYKLCEPKTVEIDIWRAIKRKTDFSGKMWLKENEPNRWKEEEWNGQ